MTVINPFDFFVEPYAESFPFAYPPELTTSLRPIWRCEEHRRRCSTPISPSIPREPRQHRQFPGRPQRRACSDEIRYVIRMEPGVQTPEETLALRAGSCRDSAWLLVQIAAPSRPRRALRLRLSDPAEARHGAARRPARDRPRLHRSARLGRGLSARRRLDRARPHLGPVLRRGPHPARRDAALSLGGADLRRGRPRRGRFRLRDERDAHPRGAAHHPAVLRRVLGTARRARRDGRRRSRGAATCA